MTRTRIARTIDAPVETVFEAVADISNFSRAVPDIVRVEFLTESRAGVGTRFRETRVMRGREASTVLEVTEHVRNERVRLVADAGGTVWDSLFTVVVGGGGWRDEVGVGDGGEAVPGDGAADGAVDEGGGCEGVGGGYGRGEGVV